MINSTSSHSYRRNSQSTREQNLDSKIKLANAQDNTIELINQIVTNKGYFLTKRESEALDLEIQNKSTTFEEGIRIVHQKVCHDKSPLKNKKLQGYIYKELLLLPAAEFSRIIHLFKLIPQESRMPSIFHSLMIAADGVKDYPLIKRTFEEAKKAGHHTTTLYSVFIRFAWHYGDAESAEKGFLEGKTRGCSDFLFHRNYMRSAASHGVKMSLPFFNEAILAMKDCDDCAILNSFIYEMGNQNDIKIANKIFEEVKRKKIANEATFISFMKAAAKIGEFNYVYDAFKEGKSLFKYSLALYTTFIHIAGQFRRHHEAKEAYFELKNTHLADYITHCTFLDTLTLYDQFVEIKELFFELKKSKEVKFFNSFMNAAGRCDHFKEAEDTFNEMVKQGLADKTTFISFMKAAHKYHQYEALKKAFEIAKKQKKADKMLFTQFINAASEYKKFEDVMKAMNEARDLNITDLIMYTRFMIAAIKNRHEKEASIAFQEAKSKKMVDIMLYGSLIEAYGDQKQWEKSKQIFVEAKQNHLIDIKTYNIYLEVLRKNQQFKEAEEIFNEIIELKIADTVSYNTYLNTCAKDFESCKKISKQMTDLFIFDQISYLIFISNAGKLKKYQEAQTAFQEGIKRFPNSNCIYNAFLGAAFQNSDPQKATEIYNEMRIKEITNEVTYTSFIRGMITFGNFQTINSSYLEAKKLRFADAELYSIYIEAAGVFNEKEEAKRSFQEAFKLGITEESENLRIYNNFIHAIGDQKNFKYIEEMFYDIKKKQSDPTYIYSIFIKIAGNNGYYEKSKKTFIEAVELKIANEIIFLTFISIAGDSLNFTDAKMAYRKGMESFPQSITIFNAFLNAAKNNDQVDDLEIAFKLAKDSKRVDSFSYCTYMQHLAKHKDFKAAKACFEESEKKQLLDTYTKNAFIEIAGEFGEFNEAKMIFRNLKTSNSANKQTYEVYIAAMRKVGGQKSSRMPSLTNLKNALERGKDVEFQEIIKETNEQYHAAIKLGYFNTHLFNHYIYLTLQSGEIEEAAAALQLAEKKKMANSITYNLFFNSDIKLEEIPNMGSLDHLNEAERQFVRSKQSPSLKLLERLERMKKNSLSKVGKTKKRKVSSEVLTQQIHTPQVFQSHEGVKYQLSVKEILNDFQEEAKELGIEVQNTKLTGGSVPYCLGVQFYREELERKAGSKEDPFFDEEARQYFDELCGERFIKNPNDWDYKKEVSTTKPEEVLQISNRLPKKISELTLLSEDHVKMSFFDKQKFVNESGNLFSIRNISNQDFIICSPLERRYLFFYDALQINLGDFSNFTIPKNQLMENAVEDYVLKRLRTNSPETINEYGWGTYFARLAQGCFCDDPKLEAIICYHVSHLKAEDKMYSLKNSWRNHCQKNPEKGIAMLFQSCCALFEAGDQKMAEELRACAGFIKDLEYEEGLFHELNHFWLIEENPLLCIKAVLEAIAIFHLLADGKKSEIQCRVEKHKQKQYIHMNVKGVHLLLPFSAKNTFHVLSKALETKFLPSLQKLFHAIMPEDDLEYASLLSESVAKVFSIKMSDLELIDARWPQLRSLCLGLKKSFSLKEKCQT